MLPAFRQPVKLYTEIIKPHFLPRACNHSGLETFLEYQLEAA